MGENFGNNNLLLVIDPQNDFVSHSGTMYIPHAEDGIKNLCRWIDINRKKINSIILTADTHYTNAIFHPKGWHDEKGHIIDPYTIITSGMVESGKYIPVCCSKEEAIKYLKTIESQGKQHTIWPRHCLAKSTGQSFPDSLITSLDFWCEEHGKGYGIFEKGSRLDKEMYSAFSYADDSMPEEGKHRLDSIWQAGFDKIFVAGFARDYCVAESVRDILKDGRFSGKLVFLPECMATINSKNPSLNVYKEAIEKYGAKEEKLV